MCLWNQEAKVGKRKGVRQSFEAVLSGSYDHPFHELKYRKQKANPLLGTCKCDPDSHAINLATLETDMECYEGSQSGRGSCQFLEAWVKTEYVQLPFIHEGLGLKVSSEIVPEGRQKRKRRRNASSVINSESD